MITMKLSGDKEALGFFSKLPERLRVAKNDIELDIAKDAAKQARFQVSRRFKQRSGRMRESIKIEKFGNHWGVKAGGDEAPYFRIQEEGFIVRGWHFEPWPGHGRHSEGLSWPGGMIRIPARHPFLNAVMSTSRRSSQIAERRLKQIGVRQ